ncbi:SCO1664 family protein [Streptomonospora nanhaiensis]|uniref:Putative repeat protein (TIGR03843 family) n=1 Tax=Streptomonospora nanhaiensis TaxID=1323731 RepID=A0A853BFA8_9ACTN|nr:SCO1664 family protein [Streptomonospora nanhaiensis]MBV2363731.1 SCO1664 family protein [Streptomonospora nanhaiensis]MBX9387803.1 SCO1664 family protein [Streptomonospora nanhaiensis]NYI93969.1 putative repeat protein (TIGR03843 family) [Streptomonospora nanhaiensis]
MTASFEGLSATDAVELLSTGELTPVGRLTDASNATLYCTIAAGGTEAACVYKPVAGERPLWDFPDGTLAGRELSAFAVSDALGWEIVPPTVYRDGPFGEGMVQLWIDGDPEVDLIELSRATDHEGLRRMAVFDAVINNSDRKIGHLLPTRRGHLYGCDHGVCFSEEYKLRTVLWQWQGEPLTEEALAGLALLEGRLADPDSPVSVELRRHLTEPENFAVRNRVRLLLHHKVHPYPSPDWPAIPWPPV